jgi:hypothetical protein
MQEDNVITKLDKIVLRAHHHKDTNIHKTFKYQVRTCVMHTAYTVLSQAPYIPVSCVT